MGKIAAVIPAAGMGLRMGGKVKKQYMQLAGKPILAYTLQVFQSCFQIDDIILVSSKEEEDYCWNKIVRPYSFSKVKKIVSGGATRQESVFNGLKAVSPDTEYIVIHDGVRPLITDEIINKTIGDAQIYQAAVSAVPAKNTVKISDNRGFVQATPDRKYIWEIHTPQVFSYNLILEAHRQAEAEGHSATDDATLVERIGRDVKLTTGSYTNIKITTLEDLLTAENFLKKGDTNIDENWNRV